MAANSATVAVGNDGTASQYNNLRLDVLDPTTGHSHTGAADGGKKIPGVWLTNDGLQVLDTNASHYLIIKPGSDISADRILTITTGDAARTITLSGNPTLADWFDQAVKAASSPTFANVNIPTTGKVSLNAGGTTYISETSANILSFIAGSATAFQATSDLVWFSAPARCYDNLIVNATKKLYLDGGGDTYITESAANVISIYTAGAENFKIDANGRLFAPNLGGTGGGNLDVNYIAATKEIVQVTSARKYKENLRKIEDLTQRVMNLQVWRADRKDGSIKDEICLIADEVYKEFPEIVPLKDGEPESITYSRLATILLPMVQQLRIDVDRLLN